jgi:NAD(P)-dependent dehydrogenase (short-subunit alcohol dehydrogenase family)
LELGGNVVATCRNPETAVDLNQLTSVYSEPRLVILPLDVTKKEALEDIRGVIRRKGIDTIDVCIANAGVASKNHPYDPAWTCPEDDLLNTFQTNTMGTLFTGNPDSSSRYSSSFLHQLSPSLPCSQ